MAAVIDEHQIWADSNGKPIVNGFIYIGQTNSDTKNNLIGIFSDRDLNTALANPQRTDGFGRSVNKIWVSARFSILVEDVNNVQKFSDQDAGGAVTAVGTLVLGNVMGTNTITAQADPTLVSYDDQQQFSLKIVNTNTGATTLNVDNRGAVSIKNEGVDVAAGRLQAGQIFTLIFNDIGPIFQLASTSGGNVSGPGSAVDNRVVTFDGTTGKTIKDSGKLITEISGDVVGPGSAVANRLADFNGTTGKIIKDSGKLTADVVTGPASATDGNVPTLDSTGKVLADSGKLATDLVTGPASATDDNVAAFNGATGKIIKNTSKVASDLVTGPASATAGNVPQLDSTGKVLTDSGKLATDIVTGPVSSVDSRLADFDGTTGKVIKDSGKLTADVVTGPVSAVDDRIATFDGTTGKIIQDSGKLASDVVTGPAIAVDNRVAQFNGTTGKIIEDSGKLTADLVTGPASVVDNRVAQFNGTTGKIIEDSGKLTADLVTGPSSAVDNNLAQFNGTTGKIIEDSGVAQNQIGILVKRQIATFTDKVDQVTTIIDFDDTIPQNTEGTEFMTIAYTPLFSDSTLQIDVQIACDTFNSTSLQFSGFIAALFKDTTANALSAAWLFNRFDDTAAVTLNISGGTLCFSFEESSASTSSRTYKVRAGSISDGGTFTLTFNGDGNVRLFGAIVKSYIRVTEYRAAL